MKFFKYLKSKQKNSEEISVNEDQVLKALNSICNSNSEKGLVDNGEVQGIHIKNNKVFFTLYADKSSANSREPLLKAATAAIENINGISQAIGTLTNPKNNSKHTSEITNSNDPEDSAGITKVKHIIAIASGKGGVGKSTVAANLAIALKTIGYKVGLLDADIYGPSQPRMMGASGKPESDGKTMLPHYAHGIPIMSIGFMVDSETPMIWRGPMVQSALIQLLEKVVWGELDILIVDMPPGTGDIQLTLSQQVPLSGAIIVSTPQDVALLDAVKALKMFEKVNVPILGIIENMSYFICPKCNQQSNIFAHGGAHNEAKNRNIPYLGGIPIALEIRSASDEGTPIMASPKDNIYKNILIDIANKLTENLNLNKNQNNTPEIIFS